MGLDITAYEKVTLVHAMGVDAYNGNERMQEAGDQDGHTYICQDGERAQSDGMLDGIYRTSGESVRFRAGSYSGYNEWRDWLARTMLGMSAEQVWKLSAAARAGLPFVELIDFSDREGFIGPKTSAKLAKDFAEHKARIPRDADPDYVRKYNEWQEAFVLAACGGVVDLH